MAKVNFTAGRLADFTCPADKDQAFLWDSKAPGLALRVTAQGARAYIFGSGGNCMLDFLRGRRSCEELVGATSRSRPAGIEWCLHAMGRHFISRIQLKARAELAEPGTRDASTANPRRKAVARLAESTPT